MSDFAIFLRLFASGSATGYLLKRQTTYWDIQVSTDSEIAMWRVSFPKGAERHAPNSYFTSVLLYNEHPLLLDYQEQWHDVYISGSHSTPDKIIGSIEQFISQETFGYRSANHYLNKVARTVLMDGNGLLLSAPSSIVSGLMPILQGEGINLSILALKPTRPPVQAFLLGEGYILASNLIATQKSA